MRAALPVLALLLVLRGCTNLNLQVRATNTGVIDSYRSLGSEPYHAATLGTRLIADPSPQ